MKRFSNHIDLGKEGEKAAAKFLKRSKHKIIGQNIDLNIGEIDIVAFDKCEKCLCFIEVKTRTSADYGMPREAVDAKRQHRYKNAAVSYMKMHNLLNAKIRFDVIEILNKEIIHIKNAF